ncbi:MAG: hypothetical protein AB7F75_01795 [Planctomycetota bacterium]
MSQRNGFILVIVVALLGVLGFIAVDFAFQSRQSRQLSQGSLDLTRATLSARSGLEKGLEAMTWQAKNPGPTAFEAQLDSAGEDVNRNGLLDVGEDVDGDGRISALPFEEDLTPSLALLDATGTRSLLVAFKGIQRGISWRNSPANPDQFCAVRITVPCLEVNAGVEAGEGPAGNAYDAASGFSYTYLANDPNHPFNQPIRRLLNAWGNYHKYRAMVRPDKTYNFDLSTDMGRIDSTRNLMPDLASAHLPSSAFDDFNPSGNHTLDAAGSTVFTEPPLGDLLIGSRPTGGYPTAESTLSVVEEYIKSWVDKTGRGALNGSAPWLYADGSPIPLVTQTKVRAIVDEFRSLAVVRPPLEPRWVFKKTMPVPGNSTMYAGVGGGLGYFESNANRRHMFTHRYSVPALRVDVTRAPASMLAALVHSATAKLQAFDRTQNTMPLGTNDNPIPFQSENNHPCASAYGSTRSLINGRPLFSMTESIQMARDMMQEREANRFQHSICGLRDFLRSWRKGYDAKHPDVFAPDHQFNADLWSLPPAQFDEVSNYYDFYHGHRRVQLLAELLNPHLNDARVIWDEALPLAVENRKNRLTTANNPFKGLFFTMDEMDEGSCEIGALARFTSPSTTLCSLGWTSPGGSVRRITARARIFDTLSVGTQQEFADACRDPVTLGTTLIDWVSYPELPGIQPNTLTGHLALKPSCPDCPYGEDLRLRVKLNGYDPATGPTQPVDGSGNPLAAWPVGPRYINGGSNVKARGIFRNSLQPPPMGPPAPLYPLGVSSVDTASDLLPGGGIRMSPWHNSKLRGTFLPPNWPNRREALLVLRNSLVTAADDAVLPLETHDPGSPPFVLPSFQEGAVSFYVKPRFHCDGTDPNGAAATLFYMPFNAFDQETYDRCTATLGLGAAEATTRSQFTGSLRLSWWSHPHWVTGPRYCLKPDSSWRWPAVSNFAGFAGQEDAGPYYFSGMEGRIKPAGTIDTDGGYVFDDGATVFGSTPVLGGDGIEGHWRVPNPSSNEVLVLEWEIHKHAYHDDYSTHYPSLPVPNVGVSNAWGFWNTSDDFKELASACSYLIPSSKPLWIFDTSDPANPEYHSVRKCFFMERPVKWEMGPDDGTQPRDRRGDLQAMLESGRWNHVFIAWRDLWGVLGNSLPTRGGCLAVYLNGSYRKVSPQGYASSAILFNMDSSPAYRGSLTLDTNYSWWPAPTQHLVYQQIDYQGPLSTWGATTSGFGKTFCVPMPEGHTILPLSPPMWQTQPPLLSMGLGYANSFYSYLDSPRKLNLVKEFPPQFYFGFEPHTVYRSAVSGMTVNRHNYGASNILWGSVMDIQIFGRVAQSGALSLLQGDGGFIPELSSFNDFMKAYPSSASVDIYPLQVGGAAEILAQRSRLVSLSWSAHIPEFHQFWDDQNDMVPGPDPDDTQTLSAEMIHLGVPLSPSPAWRLSQLPGSPPLYHVSLSTPIDINRPEDLCIRVQFNGPRVTMATPLIENIDLVFEREQLSYEFYQMDGGN